MFRLIKLHHLLGIVLGLVLFGIVFKAPYQHQHLYPLLLVLVGLALLLWLDHHPTQGKALISETVIWILATKIVLFLVFLIINGYWLMLILALCLLWVVRPKHGWINTLFYPTRHNSDRNSS